MTTDKLYYGGRFKTDDKRGLSQWDLKSAYPWGLCIGESTMKTGIYYFNKRSKDAS